METLKLETMTSQEISIIRFSGIIDNQIKGRLEDLFATITKKVVLDFMRSERINSMGITVLLKTLKHFQGNGGVICYVSLNRLNSKLFRMVGLTKLGKIFATLDDAMLYLASNQSGDRPGQVD